MKGIWLLARATYRRRVRSGAFLILTIAIPALMAIVGGIAVVQEAPGELPTVGLVDRTGELARVERVWVEEVELRIEGYAEAAAQEALRGGEIGGYLVVPEGYLRGEKPVFHSESEPSATLESALVTLLRRAMLPEADDWKLDRLEDPATVTYVASATGDRMREGPALVARIALPMGLAFVFALAVFTGSNQMGSAVVLEKEQRAMELVVSSISALELVAGKVLGLVLLGLTQVGAWLAAAAVAVGLLAGGSLAELSVPWGTLIWAALLGVPGYFLYAVLGAGLGIVAGGSQQARQLSGILGFVGLSPLYFVGALVGAPDGPLAVALTIFPLTAPMIGMFRMAMTEVPATQLAAGVAVLAVSLALITWAVARIFRAAMLLYGQTMAPGQILEALRRS